MATKVRYSGLLGVLLLSASCHAETAERVHYTPIEYLRNFALSACVAEGYASSAVAAKDAVASADGYMELGSLDIAAYNEARALVQKFLAKEYPSLSGEKLIMMKCVDLYHSKELDRIAKKYAKHR
jgi:hypothetical protein